MKKKDYLDPKSWQRNCPLCSEVKIYEKYDQFYHASLKNSKCYDCWLKSKFGETNPFYGKKHSKKTKDNVSNYNKNVRVLSEEFIEKARKNLAKVTNKIPVKDIWNTKYSKEEAQLRVEQLHRKQSENSKGSKNPMFGKPSPQGSGNGWSGWYKNWYFRSLKELSYVRNFLEKNNLEWESVNYNIPYVSYDGNERTYTPDFLVIIEGIKVLVEIKPKRLHNTPLVLLKAKAAEDFCKDKDLVYQITDCEMISSEEIGRLHHDKQIIFLPRYEEKFKEKYLI